MLHRPPHDFFASRMPLPRGRGRIAVWVVAAVLTGFAAAGIPRLTFAGFGGLFDPADPGEARYADYQKQFDHGREAIVLIDTGERGEQRETAEAAARALGESLEEERQIDAVVWAIDPLAVSPKLIQTLPTDELQAQTNKIAQLRPLLESPSPTALLQAGMVEAMRASGEPTADDLTRGAAVFTGLMEAFTQRMQTPADEPVDVWSALQSAAGEPSRQLLRSVSGRLLVLQVELREGVGGQPGVGGSLEALRRQVEAVRLRFEGLDLGITGYEPTKREAEVALRSAGQRAAGGALLGMLLLTGLAWRSVWLPAVAVGLPALAVTWMLGLLGWVLGEVNALAVGGVLVAGLMSWFGGLMLAGMGSRGVIRRQALTAAGPMLLMSGLVLMLIGVWLGVWGDRALSMWPGMAATPGLVGLREAGWSVVMGVAVAWGMVWVVGPACLAERRTGGMRNEARGEMAWALSAAAGRRPGVAWLVVGVMVLGAGGVALRTPGSADPSGFVPGEIEGAAWQRRAWEAGGEWSLPMVCVARGMGEATAWTEALRARPEVAAVTGIGRLIPEDRAAKRVVLTALDEQIGLAASAAAALSEDETGDVDTPLTNGQPTNHDALVQQVRLIRTGLELLPASLRSQLGVWDGKMKAAADDFVASAEALAPNERAARLAALGRDYDAARQQAGRLVRGVLDPSPLTMAEIEHSGGLFDAWIASSPAPGSVPGIAPGHDSSGDGAAGSPASEPVLMLRVYPATLEPGWPTAAELAGFREAVHAVDPQATGTLERLMARSETVGRATMGLVVLLVLVWCGVAVSWGAGWRATLGGGLAIAGSAAALRAGVGLLDQPMTAMAWAVWPMVGGVGVMWAAACAGVREKTADDETRSARRAATGEAFGLLLATGFIVAAGLRWAGAPGLTATAVAACLAVGLSGLWVLLLIPAVTNVPQHTADET